jgi:hypothetical protein
MNFPRIQIHFVEFQPLKLWTNTCFPRNFLLMAIGNIFFLKQYFVSKQCSRGSKREINRIIRSSIGFLLYFFSSRFLEFVLVFIIDFKTFKWIEKYLFIRRKLENKRFLNDLFYSVPIMTIFSFSSIRGVNCFCIRWSCR